MNKRPISIIIDDPAPHVHLYHYHMEPQCLTEDGRWLLESVPNEQLDKFVQVIKRRGIKGKFSVIPMAAGRGSLKEGFIGADKKDVDQWVETVKKDVRPQFAICSEILTHYKAVDLATGDLLEQNEQEWVRTHSLQEVTDYVAASLKMLDEAGLDPSGVTSPWMTGIEVEDMYHEAVSRAFDKALGKKDAWYFLHCYDDGEGVMPKVYTSGDRRIVSISGTFDDNIWRTINTPDDSDEMVRSVADLYISEDGKKGQLIDQLKENCWPVLLTHWQSLYSNGLGTGLRALDLVGERIQKHLSDKGEGVDFNELMELALNTPELYV